MAQPKIILSGIQPTNQITLGNYLGALKNWVKLQQQYRCYFAVVDLHSLVTTRGARGASKRQKAAWQRVSPTSAAHVHPELADDSWYALAAYLAAGIDPAHACLFVQSHVAAHCELAWILNCFTWMGELGRMTQFKDKSAKEGTNIPAGLFNYPVLMAADILLYQAALVPVGEDQRQHLELTRTLAQRLNKHCQQPLFKVPVPYIAEVGAKIMDLHDPRIKMSKTAIHADGAIFLSDDADTISRKIKRATTDSGSDIIYDPATKPGVSNLLVIQAVLRDLPVAEITACYRGQGYGKLKSDTVDIVVAALRSIQSKINTLLADRAVLQQVLATGTEQAQASAQQTLDQVRAALGLLTN